ncbi:hypothetical protein E2320_017947, partial [Naja naja]
PRGNSIVLSAAPEDPRAVEREAVWEKANGGDQEAAWSRQGSRSRRAQDKTREGCFGKEESEEAEKGPSSVAGQDEFHIPPPVSQGKWKNKERVLIFSSRGINFRTRHLMKDLRTLMPHSKADTKMDRKDKLFIINEVFDQKPHYALLKELFIQIFSTPQYHPRSQPFVDHVFTFSITDERIWFRNYQIIEDDGALVEIGPRFVLNLIKIFQGSFGGQTLYENPHYQSPNMHRRELRLALVAKFREKQNMKQLQKLKSKEDPALIPKDPTEEVFETPAEEKPMEIELVRPEPKVSLKKKKKKVHQRQRKWKKKLGRSGVQN